MNNKPIQTNKDITGVKHVKQLPANRQGVDVPTGLGREAAREVNWVERYLVGLKIGDIKIKRCSIYI